MSFRQMTGLERSFQGPKSRINVLYHGEVREVGSPAELMARQGLYYRLYQLQYEREELQRPPHDHAPKILG